MDGEEGAKMPWGTAGKSIGVISVKPHRHRGHSELHRGREGAWPEQWAGQTEYQVHLHFNILWSSILDWEHDAKSDSVAHTRQHELCKGPSILLYFFLCQCQSPSRYRNSQDQPEHYFNEVFLFPFLSLQSNFYFWQWSIWEAPGGMGTWCCQAAWLAWTNQDCKVAVWVREQHWPSSLACTIPAIPSLQCNLCEAGEWLG